MLGLNVAGQHKHVESRKQPKNGVCGKCIVQTHCRPSGSNIRLAGPLVSSRKQLKEPGLCIVPQYPQHGATARQPAPGAAMCLGHVRQGCSPRPQLLRWRQAGIIDLRVAFLLVGDMGLRQHKTRLKVVNGSFYRNPRTAASI